MGFTEYTRTAGLTPLVQSQLDNIQAMASVIAQEAAQSAEGVE
jgi:hypothetical protein